MYIRHRMKYCSIIKKENGMEATHRNSASWYATVFVLVSFFQPNTNYSFLRGGNFNTGIASVRLACGYFLDK